MTMGANRLELRPVKDRLPNGGVPRRAWFAAVADLLRLWVLLPARWGPLLGRRGMVMAIVGERSAFSAGLQWLIRQR